MPVENLKLWNSFNQPPPSALKTILKGRLKGKSDINPQWRYKALTEQFGVCGFGWKYTIDKLWLEPGANDEMFAFAQISLYLAHNDKLSDPIPGIGGSKLIQREHEGRDLHNNDEAYKMAVTDALSVSFKMLGGAADVYMGLWDGTKYLDAPEGDNGKLAGWLEEVKKLEAESAETVKAWWGTVSEQCKKELNEVQAAKVHHAFSDVLKKKRAADATD